MLDLLQQKARQHWQLCTRLAAWGLAILLTVQLLGGAQVRATSPALPITESAPPGIFYAHTDPQDTVRALTDANGQRVQTNSFDAWGRVRRQSGQVPQGLGWQGLRPGTADGLVSMRARHYNPESGVFQQRDSVLGDTARPQSLHRHVGLESDPLNGVDPSGHTTLVRNYTPLPFVPARAIDPILWQQAYAQRQIITNDGSDSLVYAAASYFVGGIVSKSMLSAFGSRAVGTTRLSRVKIGALAGAAEGAASNIASNSLAQRPVDASLAFDTAIGGFFGGIGGWFSPVSFTAPYYQQGINLSNQPYQVISAHGNREPGMFMVPEGTTLILPGMDGAYLRADVTYAIGNGSWPELDSVPMQIYPPGSLVPNQMLSPAPEVDIPVGAHMITPIQQQQLYQMIQPDMGIVCVSACRIWQTARYAPMFMLKGYRMGGTVIDDAYVGGGYQRYWTAPISRPDQK